MGRFLKYIDGISELMGRFASLLILIVTGVVLYEVLMRYIFSMPTIWSFEMSGFLFGSFWVLGGAYTLLHEGHVRMDILYSRLSARKKAIMDIATFIFVLCFLVVLVWKGWTLALRAIQFGERSETAWGPLLWPTKILIPIGAFLLLLQGLAKFARDIVTARERKVKP